MRTLIYALLAFAFAGIAFAQTANVPEPFRGAWASRPEACGKGYAGSLTITATEMSFLDSTGKVLVVRVRGPRDIEVELEMRGGSDVWKNTRKLVLSEDGQHLTNISGGDEVARVRCR